MLSITTSTFRQNVAIELQNLAMAYCHNTLSVCLSIVVCDRLELKLGLKSP